MAPPVDTVRVVEVMCSCSVYPGLTYEGVNHGNQTSL